MSVAEIYLSGASSDGGSQALPIDSLGNFRSSTKLNNVVNIQQPVNVTGVSIDKVSGKHNFKPVTGTVTSGGNTVKNAGLNTPTGAATWKPNGNDTLKLLLNMGFNGTVQDESGNGHVVTHNGGVATVNNDSPFTEGRSLSLDGVDDYLSLANHADFLFGSNDFTIDCRIKTSDIGTEAIVGVWNTTGNQRSWEITHNNGIVTFAGSVDGTATGSFSISSTTSINDGTWHHIRGVRTGNVQKLFIDGTKEGSDGAFTGSLHASTAPLLIGARDSVTPTLHVTGNITDIAIENAKARSIVNFTPETTQQIGRGSTRLLVNMNGAEASTTFTDESLSSHTITANGNAKIDTTDDPFGDGNGSAIFDGTGDTISVTDSDDFHLAGNDLTIEAWIKTTETLRTAIATHSGSGNNTSWVMDIDTNKARIFVSSNGTSQSGSLIATTSNVNDGNWNHIEVTRSGDTWRIFFNGTLEASMTNTAVLFNSAIPLEIGSRGNTNLYFNGNIDGFRLINGNALHIASFTPPTKEHDIALKQLIEFTAFGETVREEEHPVSSTDQISRSNTQTSFIRVDTGAGSAQPSQSITVNDAISTLTYTNAGTTLQYTAPGDTIGAAVNVGAGGTFEIASNNTDLFINVTVIGGSLPGSDQSDNLTITQGDNLQNLFDNITANQATTGITDYRALIIKNESGGLLQVLKFFIEQESLNLETSYEIAIERPSNDINGFIQTIASPTTAPTGLTFSKPTVALGLAIAQTDLPDTNIYGLWVKRIIPAGTTLIDNNTVQIGLQYIF